MPRRLQILFGRKESIALIVIVFEGSAQAFASSNESLETESRLNEVKR